jgi:hypothetical protein
MTRKRPFSVRDFARWTARLNNMDIPKLLQSLPVLFLAAESPSSCTQTAQDAANTQVQISASASPTPVPPLGNLSIYSTADLETYQNYCDVQVKNSLARGDTAGAQKWAAVRSAIAAEKELRVRQPETQPRTQQPPARQRRGSRVLPHPHKRSYKEPQQERHHEPQREAPEPKPEKYPLPPGWPVGPKE